MRKIKAAPYDQHGRLLLCPQPRPSNSQTPNPRSFKETQESLPTTMCEVGARRVIHVSMGTFPHAPSQTGCESFPSSGFPEEAERFFFERLLPYTVDKAEPFTVADICCGSGVMLLAAAKQFPRWAIDSGLVQFYGVDIDPLCVEMCRLNMRLYGIEPLALWGVICQGGH
jgi:hypothetical protein